MARKRVEPVSSIVDNPKAKKKDRGYTIMIDDEWGFEFVPMNIVVIRKRLNKKGVMTVYPLSYHATLEGAVFNLYRIMVSNNVMSGSIETIEGLKGELHRVSIRLINSVKGLGIRDGKASNSA